MATLLAAPVGSNNNNNNDNNNHNSSPIREDTPIIKTKKSFINSSSHNKQLSLSSVNEDEEEIIPTTLPIKATNKKRVQFPSARPKLETHRAISRLSSRSLEEINAVWENEQEERERKQKLKQDLDRVAQVLNRGGEEKSNCNNNNNNSFSSSNSIFSSSSNNHDNDNDLLDGSSRCILGLDDKIGDRAEEKLQHREIAWDAVLWEQHYQWEDMQRCDYDVLAKVYSETARTEQVQRQAQQVAKQLEDEIVQNVRQEPEVMELLSRSDRSTASSSNNMQSSSYGKYNNIPRSCLMLTNNSTHSMGSSMSFLDEDENDNNNNNINNNNINNSSQRPTLLSQRSSQRISFSCDDDDVIEQ